MFGQMTKKRSVSTGLPGPTSASHQPGLPVTGCTLADILVAGQGVAEKDGIRFGGVERAVRLVGNGEGSQELPGFEAQGGVVRKDHARARRAPHLGADVPGTERLL